MKKRLLSLALALLMCLTLAPTAALAANVGSIPNEWTAPTNVAVTNETEGEGQFHLMVAYTVGEDHSTFADDIYNQENYAKYGLTDAVTYNSQMQIDWRIDGGPWQYSAEWDVGEDYRQGADVYYYYNAYEPYANERAGTDYILWLPTQEAYDANNEGWWDVLSAQGVNDLTASGEGYMQLDLSKHKVDVRVRLLTCVWGPDVDAAYTDNSDNAQHIILSPWSQTASIGAGVAALEQPDSLPVPAVTNFAVGEAKDSGLVDDGYPIFTYNLTVPAEVEELAARASALWATFEADVQVKIGDGEWQDILNDGGWDTVEITSGQHTGYMPGLTAGDYTSVLGGESRMRVRYIWQGDDGTALYSDWCEPLTFGSAEWSASKWALPELKKADAMGLIPEALKDADLTLPITRAEFAAVCVKVYESLGNTTALPALTNPFTDCEDVEVLKAYNAGITNGKYDGGARFAPGELLNRQEAATMLTRVFKRCTMPGWSLETDKDFALVYVKPAAFADDADIDAWAKDSVYFMAANGIVSGLGDNKFAPKNKTDKEKAEGYADATRQQALLIAVRMVNNLGE